MSIMPKSLAVMVLTTMSPVRLVQVCIMLTSGYTPMMIAMPSAGIPAIGSSTEMHTSAPPGMPGAPIADSRMVKAIVINIDVEISRPNT